jgi:L-lactate permease
LLLLLSPPLLLCCSTEPSFSLQLGTLGTFKMSASLVLQLQQIFLLPGVSWKYETLYVPCLLPFVVAGLVTVLLYRAEMQQQQLPCYVIFTHSWRKMKGERFRVLQLNL